MYLTSYTARHCIFKKEKASVDTEAVFSTLNP